MKRATAQAAVDAAFAAHVAHLFEILKDGLLAERTDKPEVHSANPSAVARMRNGFDLARQAHKAMSDYVDSLATSDDIDLKAPASL